MLESGSVVGGRYRLLRELGRGGTGIVYLAKDEYTGEVWALKAISRETEENYDQIRKALIMKIDRLRLLQHQYLSSVLSFFEEDTLLFIVMVYIRGRTLGDVLEENLSCSGHPLMPDMVAVWAKQISEVLCYLHLQEPPVIYGDLKPGNIMIRPDGTIALIDFDSWLEEDICRGTPGFAAPEQYTGSRELGPWTDIYGLGVTLHYLLTGRDPSVMPFYFPDVTAYWQGLGFRLEENQRRKLEILSRIISRCTCYHYQERCPSCEVLLNELSREMEEEQSSVSRCRLEKRLMSAAVWIMILAVVSGILGHHIQHYMNRRAYQVCMEKMKSADGDEAVEWTRHAISLNPYEGEAYLQFLDRLIADDDFSDRDEQLVMAMLYDRAENGKKEYQSCLQDNESAYVVFSYKMGMACYYLAGESGDRHRACVWFKNVADADMGKMDLGIYNDQKEIWKTRAVVLGRLGDYDGDTVKNEVSVQDYWTDLNMLLPDESVEEVHKLAALRLYQDMVVRLMESVLDFKETGQIGREELEGLLDDICMRAAEVPAEEGEKAQKLKKNIEQAAEKVRQNIEIIYAQRGAKQKDGQ